MNAFPKRPESHRVGDEAVKIFISNCDSAWNISPIYKDYGLDLRIELTKGEEMRGHEFYVQVKGRKNFDSDKEYPPRACIKQSTVNYWMGKLCPILIALVDLRDSIICFDWVENAYEEFPRVVDNDRLLKLPLIKNTTSCDLKKEITEYIEKYFNTMRQDIVAASDSWHLTRILFHVSALVRTCAYMAIEFQRREFSDVKEMKRLFEWFYFEFAAHDELLIWVWDMTQKKENQIRRRLIEIINANLTRYQNLKEKFFNSNNKQPINGQWFIPVKYKETIEYLLPTMYCLYNIEEVLFQALALGEIVWAPIVKYNATSEI
jgi:hypothetical protein